MSIPSGPAGKKEPLLAGASPEEGRTAAAPAINWRLRLEAAVPPRLEIAALSSPRTPAAAVEDDGFPPGSRRSRLRLLLEEPQSSLAASVISVVVWSAVVGSLVAVVMESLPAFDPKVHPELAPVWFVVEVVVVTIFSMDYALRWCATHLNTWTFAMKPPNIIDLISILPFYAEMLSRLLPSTSDGEHHNLVWLRVLRLSRLLRVLQFSKYHDLFDVLIETFASAMEVLILLACFMGVATVIAGGFLWTLEQGEWSPEVGCYVREGDEGKCSPFETLPSSFYWAVTTLTTVGYGDLTPSSSGGRLVAGFSMLAGVISLALPVSVICAHFDKAMVAHEESRKLKAARRRRADNDVSERAALLDAEVALENVIAVLSELTPYLGQLLMEDIESRSPGPVGGLLVQATQNSYAALEQNLHGAAGNFKLYVAKLLLDLAPQDASTGLLEAELDYQVQASGSSDGDGPPSGRTPELVLSRRTFRGTAKAP